MPTFTGMVHEFLGPIPVKFAQVEPDRLTIRYGAWIFEARSTDAYYYQGNYGEKKIDPDRILQCWVYAGPDGTKVVYAYCHHRYDSGTQAESVFRLVPDTHPPGTLHEMPMAWDAAKAAIDTSAGLVLANPLEMVLVHDRWTGHRANQDALNHCGLYVLFYASGKIARVGQANPRTLSRRLADYELNAAGWFYFRWVAAIPVAADQHHMITPLENHLLAALNPPENTRGVVRRDSKDAPDIT